MSSLFYGALMVGICFILIYYMIPKLHNDIKKEYRYFSDNVEEYKQILKEREEHITRVQKAMDEANKRRKRKC